MPNLNGTIADFDATEAFNKFQYLNPNFALIQSEVLAILKANLKPLIAVMNSQMGLSIIAPKKFFEAPAKLDEGYIDSLIVGINRASREPFAPRAFKNSLTITVYVIGKRIRSQIQTPDMWRWAEAVSGVMYQYLNGYCTADGKRLWGKLVPNEIMALPEEFEEYSGTAISFEMEIDPGGRAWKPIA